MAKKTNGEPVVDELAAIEAEMEKVSELATRFAAHYERLVEARLSGAPAPLHEREAAAVISQLRPLVDNALQRNVRYATGSERLAATYTAAELAEIDEARLEANLAAAMVVAMILNAVCGSPASSRRLAAIVARKEEEEDLRATLMDVGLLITDLLCLLDDVDR